MYNFTHEVLYHYSVMLNTFLKLKVNVILTGSPAMYDWMSIKRERSKSSSRGGCSVFWHLKNAESLTTHDATNLVSFHHPLFFKPPIPSL